MVEYAIGTPLHNIPIRHINQYNSDFSYPLTILTTMHIKPSLSLQVNYEYISPGMAIHKLISTPAHTCNGREDVY
jgi:hypothetical protein